MSWATRIVIAAASLGCATAWAQDAPAPGTDLFDPGFVAPREDFGVQAPEDLAPVPYAPGIGVAPAVGVLGEQHDLVLEARLVDQGPPLSDGIIWRIFGVAPGSEVEMPLLATVEGGSTRLRLAAGDYLVHAAFGRVGVTRRVTIGDEDQTESLVLNAGGMRLDAVVEDEAVPADQLTFEVLQEGENGDFETVIPQAAAGRVVRLAAGTYHVISRYGTVNAVVRADIQIEPGKLTEAVMRHTGAEVTLKLVSEEGGEALANTVWTVLTQDGTTIHESIGAFPSIILAAGNYSAVASHQEQIYSRDFLVESGVDRDIEVRLTDLVQPEAEPGTMPEVTGRPMEP
jgi:hypothetical protein